MYYFDIMLIFVTMIAIFSGVKKPNFRLLLVICSALSIITWVVRFILLFKFPEDVTISEYYFYDLTVWVVASEITAFTLWLLFCAAIGLIIVRLWRYFANAH